ncbi:MAG TPA: trypsin-like peptidase domain-containing protein, partial [Gemmatimonadales bacterium]|nr:trypsin-like peptidase domain-containing protein [Gemmatimonadales bacterium]
MPGTIAAPIAAPLGAELAVLADRLARVTVRLRAAGGGEGSGVVWRERLVVSNAHVVSATRVEARVRTGETLELRVVARDARLDLALLAAPIPIRPAEIGHAEALRA